MLALKKLIWVLVGGAESDGAIVIATLLLMAAIAASLAASGIIVLRLVGSGTHLVTPYLSVAQAMAFGMDSFL